MAKINLPDITVRDAQIRYPNLEGRATAFHSGGPDKRSFQLMLPEDVAAKMAEDGWNVKETRPRRDASDEDRENFDPRPYIDVAASWKFERMAPKIRLITSTVQRMLTEDTAFLVDQAEIVRIDLTINPSAWEVGEKSGIKAYLKEAFITIHESELEKEYNHIPLEGTTALSDGPKFTAEYTDTEF